MSNHSPTRMSSSQQSATASRAQNAPMTAAEAGRLLLTGFAVCAGIVVAIQIPDLIRYMNMRRM